MLRHRDDTLAQSTPVPQVLSCSTPSSPCSSSLYTPASTAATSTATAATRQIHAHVPEFRPRGALPVAYAVPSSSAATAHPVVTSTDAVVAPDLHDDDDDEFSPFARSGNGDATSNMVMYGPSAADIYAGVAAADAGLHPLDSPPDISTLSLQVEASAPMLTPLEVFCSVFLAHNQGLFINEADPAVRLEQTSRLIQHALECSHYDVSAALQVIKEAHEAGRDLLAMEPPTSSGVDDTTTRVCRFFLAGECRRSDCRFSHDLNKALCRFWLRGQCLNDPCYFLHDYDALSMLAQSLVIAPTPPAPFQDLEQEQEGAWIERPKLDASQTPWAVAAKHAPTKSTTSAISTAVAPIVSSTKQARTATAPRPVQSHRIPLRPPSLLPTLSTGSALAIDTGKIRAAQPKNQDAWKTTLAVLHARHERLRERLQVGAGGDAGGWGASAQASQERGARGLRGRWIGSALGLCLGVAKPQVAGSSLSMDERTEAVLDLHGLHVSEALDTCEQFLLALESEGFRGLAYVCVGAGKHSVRSRGKLAGSIRDFLIEWEYPYADYDGILACDPCTHK